MSYPRIHLAIDNIFASKRWTRPMEWMTIVRDLGLGCVEASADNECDPLYCGTEYLKDWTKEILLAQTKTGVRVANLYSGHGTYATLGLAHTDVRVRDRILHQWLTPMKQSAGRLGAGLGFFCHAFPDATLQAPAAYQKAYDDLVDRLASIAAIPVKDCRAVGVEQMYSPHQIPWTVPGARKLLQDIFKKGRKPFYLTIDVGHSVGQQRFLKPDARKIASALRECRFAASTSEPWLGPWEAHMMFQKALADSPASDRAAIACIMRAAEKHPYLFAEKGDGDPYLWLAELGAYSPIIHLQQTDGFTSSHLPFTKARNKTGIVTADKVLKSLAAAFKRKADTSLPPPVKDIYLTLEIFFATADKNADILADLKESVDYWRKFVPVDNMTLDDLI
jgi:hypothetical protein